MYLESAFIELVVELLIVRIFYSFCTKEYYDKLGISVPFVVYVYYLRKILS